MIHLLFKTFISPFKIIGTLHLISIWYGKTLHLIPPNLLMFAYVFFIQLL